MPPTTRSKAARIPQKNRKALCNPKPPQPDKVQKNKTTTHRAKHPPPPPKRDIQFLWIPYAEIPDIGQDIHLSIDAPNLSDRFFAQYPMYDEENMLMIEREVGKGFANMGLTNDKPYPERRVVHQSVATMQNLRHCFDREVQFWSWEWLEKQLKLVSERRRSRHPRNAQQHELFDTGNTIPYIIFVHWTTEPGPPIDGIYAAVKTQQSLRTTLFRCSPSKTEAVCQSFKSKDIQALNAIAAASPHRYAYRPRTCFDHGDPNHDMETCCLAGQEQIIMKRGHSSGGNHVELLDGDMASAAHQKDRKTGHRWFGQEYEPFVKTFGEFRVFIVAKESNDEGDRGAIRGRNGHVLHTVITEWPEADDASSNMYVHSACAYDWRCPHIQPLTASDLHDFAIHVNNSLRRRSDWEEHYESLEVEVRLDIGVAIERNSRQRVEKRFFVNEITRFWFADYFSQVTLGAPYQHICYAFAEAMDAYFQDGTIGA